MSASIFKSFIRPVKQALKINTIIHKIYLKYKIFSIQKSRTLKFGASMKIISEENPNQEFRHRDWFYSVHHANNLLLFHTKQLPQKRPTAYYSKCRIKNESRQ